MDTASGANVAADAPIASRANPRGLSNLLFLVAAMVFAMVVVGGITRLTESGLSITEWKPIAGAIPPLTHADWVRAFDLYKQIPEYREINGPAGMTLAAFRHIYWWEFVHRLLGRLIGLVFGAGLLWFAIRRAIPRGYGSKMVALLVLGGLQGALGWYMVESGLSQRTDVSHFRLSAHLLLALTIMSALVWVALDLRRLARTGDDRPSRLKLASLATLAILYVQLLYGAWLAGLDAGKVANSWPDMHGRFFPQGVDWSRGLWWAAANDPYLVHFIHRWWAWVVVAAMVAFARLVRMVPGARPASIAIHSAFGTQVVLGILTVLSGVALWLAALHQAVGALLLASTIWGAHELGAPGRRPSGGRSDPAADRATRGPERK